MTRELRIVVLGGAGFIGSYLTNALTKREHFVFVIDHFRAGSGVLGVLEQKTTIRGLVRKLWSPGHSWRNGRRASRANSSSI